MGRTAACGSVRQRIGMICVLLAVANIGAWVWALAAFRHYPLLLGTALLAYGLGLRHAVDADHIAAIDNVTRKLMQAGQRPVGVGFFFSLGHSSEQFEFCAVHDVGRRRSTHGAAQVLWRGNYALDTTRTAVSGERDVFDHKPRSFDRATRGRYIEGECQRLLHHAGEWAEFEVDCVDRDTAAPLSFLARHIHEAHGDGEFVHCLLR